MAQQRWMIFVLGIFVALAACGEPSQPPGGPGAGQKVAPTEEDQRDNDPCVISPPEDAQPVNAEEAEVLGVESVGGELDDVETVSDTREVCDESHEVWVVTGTLPNGDDTETYVARDTGQVIYVSISGGPN